MHDAERRAVSVTIGREHGNRLVISVLGRMHGQATDFWDGNWLLSPIEVFAGGFSGRVPAGLRTDELQSFREELENAHEDFGGVARLTSMEEWLELTVTVEKSGRVEIEGAVADGEGLGNDGTGNRLSFRIDGLDQSEVPAIIDGLSAIEDAFPVLGAPRARNGLFGRKG
ncbi:WapI family immunity protein [Amycolatopsis benzoatilytica]|uniref:WapI family immunity protein n=1 Tax=Amycolatopsis benzoatilytica TaxID=346045 RepID=UPI00036CDE06|nr:hypothetical protein [Amycolatopsis benzoatilytica]